MTKKPFLPPNLPPKIGYTSLIKEIGRAHSALGQLKGSLINVPNPSLLTTPLLTREAVSSSRIEGTVATLEDVLRYEADERTTQLDEKEKDVREITNYRQAMYMAVKELDKRPIGENLIKKMHYILLDSARGTFKRRGKFRKGEEVFIGLPGSAIEDATYIPPSFKKITPLLGNWEKYVNSEDEQSPLVQAGVAHYQFEAIHPFLDGNGRIGRLLIPLSLYQQKFLPYPLLYISEYFEKNRRDYYDLLNGVSEYGDWNTWLKYFLNAITTQSLNTQITVIDMVNLHNELKNEISTLRSAYAVNLLDIIFSTPYVSSSFIRDQLKTASPQTIYNLLGKFVKAGILETIPGLKRNRVYIFKRLLDILR